VVNGHPVIRITMRLLAIRRREHSEFVFQDYSRWLVRRSQHMPCLQAGVYAEPTWLSEASKALLREMLQTDPRRRISMERLLKHTWVQGNYAQPLKWRSVYDVCACAHTPKQQVCSRTTSTKIVCVSWPCIITQASTPCANV
jgi:serine/threonine protein kinase